MIKLAELLVYVTNHPKLDRVLKGWNSLTISRAIHDSYLCNGLYYFKQGHEVKGIVISFPDATTKTLWVTALICDTKEAFKYMIDVFKRMFPGYQLAARRHGKIIVYNNGRTERLCKFTTDL